MIYLDNAATTHSKPQVVVEAVASAITNYSANPGRSAHSLSNTGARLIFNARETISKFFNYPESDRLIFTSNITQSLNMVLKGILKSGDHIIVSSMEHNSMMRPLRTLEKKGIEITVILCDKTGLISVEKIKNEIKHNTKIIAISHASNVCGSIQPITEIGRITKKYKLLFLVDSAQTAGVLNIDMIKDNIDILAFTGHKSLFGPMGIGGFILGEKVDILKMEPLIEGGTGSNSEFEDQPNFMPDRFESGTPNIPGILGLVASIEWINQTGITKIRKHEIDLTDILISGLKLIDCINIYGTHNAQLQTGVVSFDINEFDIGEVAAILEEKYDIYCRVGLHCSPVSHRTLYSFPKGTIRFSIGYYNTLEEIRKAIAAVKDIVEG